MFAVIKTGGKQYKVQEKDTLRVEKLAAVENDTVSFSEVLLIASDKDNVAIGTPTIAGAHVEATVIDQARAKKIRVVKYKPKVRYKIVHGHRQPFSEVRIDKISTK